MTEYNEIGAANSLVNLACVVECEPVLSGERVHLKILSYLVSADKQAKNAYLRVSVCLFIIIPTFHYIECLTDKSSLYVICAF